MTVPAAVPLMGTAAAAAVVAAPAIAPTTARRILHARTEIVAHTSLDRLRGLRSAAFSGKRLTFFAH